MNEEISPEALVKVAISQRAAKLKTYTALNDLGLPIPADLKREIEDEGTE